MKCSELRAKYPNYTISKNKIELTPDTDVNRVLEAIKQTYAMEEVNDIDGVKITLKGEWVHLRKSNTEPIIRIYAESTDKLKADKLAISIIEKIKSMLL